MTEPHDDGGLFDDIGSDEVVRATGPRRLVVTFGIALAAFVFIGVAAGALLFFLVLRIRDHADPNHTVRARYANSYTRCVQHGGTSSACSAQVLIACERDAWWSAPAHTGQRETVCLATVPKN